MGNGGEPGPARFGGLDALRGLAALAVALFHYTAHYETVREAHAAGLPARMPYGFLGVDLFFVISGFVILLTVERAGSLRAFARARFLRLWPTFLACCLLTVAAGWALDGATVGLVRLLANLSMTVMFWGQVPIDGSYWTLGCEVAFYAGAGTVLLGGRVTAERFCLGWLAVAALCTLAGPLVPGRVTFLVQPKFAPLFILGMAAYLLRRGRMGWTAGAAALGGLLLLALQPPHWGALLPLSGPAYAMFAASAAALVLWASRGGSRLDWAPLRWGGRVSYPFYLLHQGIGFILISRLEHAGVTPALAIGVTLAIMLGAAELVVRGVEEPVRAWARHRTPALTLVPPFPVLPGRA